MNQNKKWEKCVTFHGHDSGGLTIGYKASLLAIELLELKYSPDEQVVCVSENDACGVDSIQVLLGCSVGKGNLPFHLTGKQAFSIYNRLTGKSVRLMLRKRPEGLSHEESLTYYQGLEPRDMFEVVPTRIEVPEQARLFNSYICEICDERTRSNWIRIMGEKGFVLIASNLTIALT